jgi:DNA-binding SARP family transcriptional activator
MSTLDIRLFGKFAIYTENQAVECFRCQKALELFCYLMLYRGQPHHRDHLAETFWGDRCTAASKKYFRKTLWQLQSSLEQLPYSAPTNLLLVESDWLQINQSVDFGLDVREFEGVYSNLAGARGRDLDQRNFRAAQDAVSLYKADLLEGCYQDWCIYERERYKDMYFALVDKLMGYCESNQKYETGIVFGRKLLGIDRAREGTHLRLMRLYYLAGDRTAAIRQFESCQDSLKQEFNVRPGLRSLEVYRQIRNDNAGSLNPSLDLSQEPQEPSLTSVTESLSKIKELLTIQASIPQQILKEIQHIEATISNRR